jgi:hypothetical protein
MSILTLFYRGKTKTFTCLKIGWIINNVRPYFALLIVSELPYRIRGGNLVQFEGLPTLIGGVNSDLEIYNEKLYQYHWNEDKWGELKNVKIPTELRFFSATFEVPRDIFGLC